MRRWGVWKRENIEVENQKRNWLFKMVTGFIVVSQLVYMVDYLDVQYRQVRLRSTLLSILLKLVKSGKQTSWNYIYINCLSNLVLLEGFLFGLTLALCTAHTSPLVLPHSEMECILSSEYFIIEPTLRSILREWEGECREPTMQRTRRRMKRWDEEE